MVLDGLGYGTQPGNAAMYACTGASPSAFAICGLPPERSFTGLAFGFALPLLFGFSATVLLHLVMMPNAWVTAGQASGTFTRE
jgi:hypothetical protein